MVWKQITFNLKYTAETAKCESCGRVFRYGEKGWVRIRTSSGLRDRPYGNPMVTGYRDKPIYRCERCYDAMWH